ncbi:guanylate cyclase [Oscillatoriales cyanobacterium USR001]|nr:guanylate cyclase [Oscillatoriales cyanobacterium USR001]
MENQTKLINSQVKVLAYNPPLAAIELRLRSLLSSDLYAAAWVNPTPATLMDVFEHLRTLRYILNDYVPRSVCESPPKPGEVRYQWQKGTLMFTDLAGFTPLLEANAVYGRSGAETLLSVLNNYFASMIDIISKSGGDLLEFTGDAMLVQFLATKDGNDTARALRAGLRMQRAMNQFNQIETSRGVLSLRMRVGIHSGKYIIADIGTPLRMAHILLGNAVQQAKQAEGAGVVGRVCLTETASAYLAKEFRFESGKGDHLLVIDDLTDEQLGEYDIMPTRRRMPSSVLLDRSVSALASEIEEAVKRVEPLASYVPRRILNLLVENAGSRQIPPDFPRPTVMFVNLIGLPESVDKALPEEEVDLVTSFSRVFAIVNAAVIARGGVLQKVTAHLDGSDMLIYFGVPEAHTNDTFRAASAAIAIRDIITNFIPPVVGGKQVTVFCQIGVTVGAVFAAEVGEPRGRREFNVLGDTVNTAARLMSKAAPNQILISEAVFTEIDSQFHCQDLGAISLKGKAAPTPIFTLQEPKVVC